jgi:hypothetical protein
VILDPTRLPAARAEAPVFPWEDVRAALVNLGAAKERVADEG